MNQKASLKKTIAMVGIMDMVIVVGLLATCLYTLDENLMKFVFGMSKPGEAFVWASAGAIVFGIVKLVAVCSMFFGGTVLMFGACCTNCVEACNFWIFCSCAVAFVFVIGHITPALLDIWTIGLTPFVTYGILMIGSYKILAFQVISFYVQVEGFKEAALP